MGRTHFRATSCCGLGEIANLSYTMLSELNNDVFNKSLLKILRSKEVIYRWPWTADGSYFLGKGALFFTSHRSYHGDFAEKFAQEIRENKLGTVQKMRAFQNPNTSHHITTYLWAISYRGLSKYVEAQGWKELLTRS